jgi:HD-GYP domain-containing protein (c-di-GMP phosphodiesterase class II)
MGQRHILVADLQFGMYIAELDRPWTDTPFMFQGFYLRTSQQLDALRRFCRYVLVDVGRSDLPPIVRAPAAPPAAAADPGFPIRGTTEYPAGTELEAELESCQAPYGRSMSALLNLYRPLERGATPRDASDVLATVTQLADSVIRNPDALLLVSKVRGKSVAAHARALQVSVYMMVFGRYLGLDREAVELLGLLGMLQDIGKTRLPPDLLAKEGPLTAAESDMLKRHVELSAHLLGATPGLPANLPALALLHHERQDGTGYPRALKAYQIGLYGSIAAICDTYDAVMAFRPYAEERSPSEAVKVLLSERGKAFHGKLVDEFIQCVGAFPVGSAVELNSGEIGVVVGENPVQRLKPKVMLLRDPQGKPLAKRRIVDLSLEPETGPQNPYRVRRVLEHSKLAFDPRGLFSQAQ